MSTPRLSAHISAHIRSRTGLGLALVAVLPAAMAVATTTTIAVSAETVSPGLALSEDLLGGSG